MISYILILTVSVVIAALVFEYINGFHDTANAVTTVVSTNVLSLKYAIILAALLNFMGAFFGSAVASTIGKGLIDAVAITQYMVLAALLGAIAWNLITWYYGIPSSSSHALVGGLVGSTLASSGIAAIKSEGLIKVIKALLISPIVGVALGFTIMMLILWSMKWVHLGTANAIFRKLQIVSSAIMAFSHGSNDAQKTMALITMTLVSGGLLTFNDNKFIIPTWVMIICALTMALGTAAGGLRIIKTMGTKIVDLKPVHGFAAETAAATTILTASVLGVPVSTTHVITSSIIGAGASQNFRALRWSTTTNMLIAWMLTIPMSGLVSFMFHKVFLLFT
jgi:PiT family inorganic phosphate transporter